MSVDTGTALGAKARFAFRASDGLTEQCTSTVNGGGSGTITTVGSDTVFLPSTTPTTWQVGISGIDPAVVGSFTLFWQGYIHDDAAQVLLETQGPTYGWHFGVSGYAAGYLSVYLYSKQQGSYRGSLIWFGGATDVYQLRTIVMRFNNVTGNVEFLLDGVQMEAPNWWIKDPIAIDSTLQTSGLYGHATYPTKTITIQGYEGFLSDTEVATLVANPDYIFAVPVISGAASITEDDDTLVATGTLVVISPVVGTVAITEDDDTLAATGVLPIKGVVAITEDDDTLVGGSYDPFTRLRAILANTDLHGWVQVNTNRFLDTQPPVSDRQTGLGTYSQFSVVSAWSGFAWDNFNGNIVLWGGGHANYSGNELYIWNGLTGAWGLGSLPSALDADSLVVGSGGPQSSHTYGNNFWLEKNAMFGTFGGAAAPTGTTFEERTGSSPTTTRRVGPWLFDLSLADPTKVGGATGTGWDTTTVKTGINAWQHRRDMFDGTYPIDSFNHTSGIVAQTVEAGKDVAYLTMDSGGSGFPNYFRYEFGDVRNGYRDTCTQIATTTGSVTYDGWGVFDPIRRMVYRNGAIATWYPPESRYIYDNDLAAVFVDSTDFANNHDIPIKLFDTNGVRFLLADAGAAYDEVNDRIYLWNGSAANPGRVFYITIPTWNGTSFASTNWVVTELNPTGLTPRGDHQTGILGKFRYMPALGAIVALDSARPAPDNLDAGVWMFKTSGAQPARIKQRRSISSLGTRSGTRTSL